MNDVWKLKIRRFCIRKGAIDVVLLYYSTLGLFVFLLCFTQILQILYIASRFPECFFFFLGPNLYRPKCLEFLLFLYSSSSSYWCIQMIWITTQIQSAKKRKLMDGLQYRDIQQGLMLVSYIGSIKSANDFWNISMFKCFFLCVTWMRNICWHAHSCSICYVCF